MVNPKQDNTLQYVAAAQSVTQLRHDGWTVKHVRKGCRHEGCDGEGRSDLIGGKRAMTIGYIEDRSHC